VKGSSSIPLKILIGTLNNNQRWSNMNSIREQVGYIDEVIAKELTIDLSSGAFYQEVDDETLQMALTAMYENIEGWKERGVIIGRG
jgi:hypothetical protein|tara:strand:- start:25 stop:282 length:258 start_codon:yes stop_codon:yes gene_type:complete